MFYLKKIFRKIKNFLHFLEAFLGNFLYGFPSRNIKVIGVTGTDGKTTTTHLIYHVLTCSGKKTSMISTIYAKVGNKQYDTGLHVTTPSSFLIQKLIFQAVKNNDEFFVLETTSHGLDQNRVWGVKFEIGLITNITHEHLDYHLTYENYVKTKEKIIKLAKIGVINKKDNFFKFLDEETKKKSVDYSLAVKKIKQYFPELEQYNILNYAAAYTVCKLLKIPEKKILESMKSFKLPKGRLALVYNKKFKVIIDFAHTPQAFLSVLPGIKKKYLKKNSRLIHIFGCAGKRDFTKREKMGEISASFSDLIILTEEDYRTEDINSIFNQIKKGIERKGFVYKKTTEIKKNDKKVYTTIINREDAINFALKIVQKNDVVLLTGKAHEKSLCRGTKEYPWDEFKVVEKSLKENNYDNF
jgi:UDP-N-acetylmuramoyl-L-alanyl-D-glutamate--2,6-diaminopimelate ligase